MAIAACVWGFRNDRSLEMEAVLSSNVLLFIFVALKLDNVISWSWKAVFVPLWVVMCLPGIVAMYYVVWHCCFSASLNILQIGRLRLLTPHCGCWLSFQ